MAIVPADLVRVLPFLGGWTCGWLLFARVPRLAAVRVTGGVDDRRPAVAVVIPARDEAASIGALLASLRPQLDDRDELVVVDDDSTDDTAAIAAAAGARVVATGGAPPTGWTGKCWACQRGASATDAPIVVFLDADVTLHAGAITRLAQVVGERGGLVSVQPWHRTRRAYEQCSLPFNLVGVMGTGLCSPWAAAVRGRFAYGPVMATSRADYETAGGHGAPTVRGSVVEDIALARCYAGRVTVGLGRGLADFRMYPDGVGQLLGGWRKNIASGATAAPWWAVALTVGWLWSVIGAPGTGWPWWALSAAQVAWFGRRVGHWHPLAYVVAPVLAVLFLVVLVLSTLSRWRGATSWRGRAVPLR